MMLLLSLLAGATTTIPERYTVARPPHHNGAEAYGVWLPNLQASRHAWDVGPRVQIRHLCFGGMEAWQPGQAGDEGRERELADAFAARMPADDCSHLLMVSADPHRPEVLWARVVVGARVTEERLPAVRHVVIRQDQHRGSLPAEPSVDAVLEGVEGSLEDHPLQLQPSIPPYREREPDRTEMGLWKTEKKRKQPEASACSEAMEKLGVVACDAALWVRGSWLVVDGDQIRGFDREGLLFERAVHGEVVGECGWGFLERKGEHYVFSTTRGEVWHQRTSPWPIGCAEASVVELRDGALWVDSYLVGTQQGERGLTPAFPDRWMAGFVVSEGPRIRVEAFDAETSEKPFWRTRHWSIQW